MKTADAGYLTRRLVDVSHDVIITQEDCGTLRGLVCTALKNGDEIISSLYERILGRVSVHDIIHPTTGELIVKSGEEITEAKAKIIDESPIESVEIRSVLTCESKKGVCMKCYGRNLATARMVQLGEAVGVIAAQAIGEPGTQLTLRTFHAGGIASNAAANAKIAAKNKSRIEFDELSNCLILRFVAAPGIVFFNKPSEILSPDRSVERTDHFNLQGSCFLQKILYLNAIFSYDINKISSGIIQPVSFKIHFIRKQVSIDCSERSESICRKQDLIDSIIGNHSFRPVHHRCHHEGKGMFSGTQGVHFFYNHSTVFHREIKELF